jgi:hypothetical protein
MVFTRQLRFEVTLRDLFVAVGTGLAMTLYNVVRDYLKNRKIQQQ